MSATVERAPRAEVDILSYAGVVFAMILSLAFTVAGGWVLGMPLTPKSHVGPMLAAFACCFVNVAGWLSLRAAIRNFKWWAALGAGGRAGSLVALAFGCGCVAFCWFADVRAGKLALALLSDVGATEEKIEGRIEADEGVARAAWEDAREAERTARSDLERAQADLDDVQRTKRDYEGLPLRLREAFQRRLESAGHAPGRIDGTWGPITQGAADAYVFELEAVRDRADAAFRDRQEKTALAKAELDRISADLRAAAGRSTEALAAEVVENQGADDWFVEAIAFFIEFVAAVGTMFLKYAGAQAPHVPRRRRNHAGVHADGVGPATPGDPLSTALLEREEVQLRPRPAASEPALDPRQLRRAAQAHASGDPLRGGVGLIGKVRRRNHVTRGWTAEEEEELRRRHEAAAEAFEGPAERRALPRP